MVPERDARQALLMGRENNSNHENFPSICVNGSEERSRFQDSIQIHLAKSENDLNEARDLVRQMYCLHGFKADNIIRETENSTTIIARNRSGQILGTISIHLDAHGEGLYSDEGYKQEIDHLRRNGKSICEFNGLAFQPKVRSPQLLAHLFHIAMLLPSEMYRVTDAIIEVSYKHAKFYEKLLGFTRLGEGRFCPRVESIGVLLHRDFGEFKRKLAHGMGETKKETIKDRTFFLHRYSSIDPLFSLNRLVVQS